MGSSEISHFVISNYSDSDSSGTISDIRTFVAGWISPQLSHIHLILILLGQKDNTIRGYDRALHFGLRSWECTRGIRNRPTKQTNEVKSLLGDICLKGHRLSFGWLSMHGVVYVLWYCQHHLRRHIDLLLLLMMMTRRLLQWRAKRVQSIPRVVTTATRATAAAVVGGWVPASLAIVLVRGCRVRNVHVRRLLVVAHVISIAWDPATVGVEPSNRPKDATEDRANPRGGCAAAVVHVDRTKRIEALEASARLAARVLLGIVAVVYQASEPAHNRSYDHDQNNELGPPRTGIRATFDAVPAAAGAAAGAVVTP